MGICDAMSNTGKDMAFYPGFGAWCVRDYGFDYSEVRKHSGIAFTPMWKKES